MTTEWWKALGLFGLAMMAISFWSPAAAIVIIVFVGLAAVILRLDGKKIPSP